MRLFKFIFVLSLLLSLGAVTASAQQRDSDGDGVADSVDNCPNEAGPSGNDGCPLVFVAPPNQPADTDGDGLNDSDDNCPTVAGPRTNQGCPETPPPTSPDPNDPPPNDPPNREPDTSTPPQDSDGDGISNDNDQCPQEIGTLEFDGCPPPPAVPDFNPPLLSNDACFVTASGDYNARVRNNPALEADHIGNLLAGVIYPAAGIVNAVDGQWIELAGEFQHLDLEATNGLNGYVSDTVVNYSDCPMIEASQTIQVPINEHACTVITAFNWIFAFNYAPGEAIPEGTHPLSILNGDLENYGDVNQWASEIQDLNGDLVEYMSFGIAGEAGYMSYPRTGGDCGRIGEPTVVYLRDDDRANQPIGIGLEIVFIDPTPPELSDELIIEEGDGTLEVPEETLDEVMEWIDMVCGGGAWMISLGTNAEGEVVVKNAQCL